MCVGGGDEMRGFEHIVGGGEEWHRETRWSGGEWRYCTMRVGRWRVM